MYHGDRGDEEIKITDQPTCTLERGGYFPVGLRAGLVEFEYCQVGEKLHDLCLFLVGVIRKFDSDPELRHVQYRRRESLLQPCEVYQLGFGSPREPLPASTRQIQQEGCVQTGHQRARLERRERSRTCFSMARAARRLMGSWRMEASHASTSIGALTRRLIA